jgi:hypothetical protein
MLEISYSNEQDISYLENKEYTAIPPIVGPIAKVVASCMPNSAS